MQKTWIVQQLREYPILHPGDSELQQKFINFVEEHPNFYSRDLALGHLTGSAWILGPSLQEVLLIHHKKLDKWLQPGGHTEPKDVNMQATALREAQEETGITQLSLYEPKIFDLDIHWIPARKEQAGHWHYDVRYCLVAQDTKSYQANEETQGIAWCPGRQLRQYTEEVSILRMWDKTQRFLV